MPVAVTQQTGLVSEPFWVLLRKDNFFYFPGNRTTRRPSFTGECEIHTLCFSLKTTREGTYFGRGDLGLDGMVILNLE